MRILVVEDNEELAGLLKSILAAQCFAVDMAHDGEKGSYFARVNDYDLIILDNMLPKKDGCSVCREIRAAGKGTPVLILSALSDTPTKIKLLDSGADDYLTKPFSGEELLARIRAVLRRPRQMEEDILAVDNLTLDAKKQLTLRDKKEIYLTKKEFSLLEFLIKNRGNVVSRSAIMEHVWNAEADPFSNTIEMHILWLRKKIDFGKNKKLIHTVPGRGYKIDVR